MASVASGPFRKNSDPVDRGRGNSLVGKFKVIGAVGLVDRFTPGRIRLEHIQQSDAASIWPFGDEQEFERLPERHGFQPEDIRDGCIPEL